MDRQEEIQLKIKPFDQDQEQYDYSNLNGAYEDIDTMIENYQYSDGNFTQRYKKNEDLEIFSDKMKIKKFPSVAGNDNSASKIVQSAKKGQESKKSQKERKDSNGNVQTKKKLLSKSFNTSSQFDNKLSQSMIPTNALSLFKDSVRYKLNKSDKKNQNLAQKKTKDDFEIRNIKHLNIEFKSRKRYAEEIYRTRWKSSILSYQDLYLNNMDEFWKDLTQINIPPIYTFG